MSKDSAALREAFKEAFSAQQIEDVRPLLAEAIKGVGKASGLDLDVAALLVKRELEASQQKEMKEIGRLEKELKDSKMLLEQVPKDITLLEAKVAQANALVGSKEAELQETAELRKEVQKDLVQLQENKLNKTLAAIEA